MTTRNDLSVAAARARAAKPSPACGGCGYRRCKCHMHQPDIPDDGTESTITPADVKNIVIDCASDLGLVNETAVKLIAQACVSSGAVSEERIKEIVTDCSITMDQVKSQVLQCLLEQESGITIVEVQSAIDESIDSLNIPEAVTEDFIKVAALQCVLDNKVTDEHIKSIAVACVPDLPDFKACLLYTSPSPRD